MKKIFLVTSLFIVISISAFGQISIIREDGTTHESGFGSGRTVADWIFEFRLIYDRYPNAKDELLNYFLGTPYTECGVDFIDELISYKDSVFVEWMMDKNSTLTTSGDTCLFHTTSGDNYMFLNSNETFRFVGGAEELIKNDSSTMYDWGKTHPCCYDVNGRCLRILPIEPFPCPCILQEQFKYIVTMKSTGVFKSETDMDMVLMPFSITREGDFFYDFSYLEGVKLFYQEQDEALDLCNSHRIEIVEAIDPDYLEMVKSHMNSFMKKHPDVERMRIWKEIRFNYAPSAVTH